MAMAAPGIGFLSGVTSCRRTLKVLVIAVFALHPGKAIPQDAAIQVSVNDFLEMGSEKTVELFKPFFVDLEEGFKILLDAPIIIGNLRIAGPINDGRGGRESSSPRKTGFLL